MTQFQKPQTQLKPLERKTRPPRRGSVDMKGMLSVATMLVSLVALTIAMGAGVKLVIDIFAVGLENSMSKIVSKIIVLGCAFFFGWVIGLISIRGFGNRLYPRVIKIYAWGTLVGVGLLYIKVVQKLFLQGYDDLHFGAYLMMLFGGLLVLLCLHLMVEYHDLRPFAIPLFIVNLIQLGLIVVRYVIAPSADTSYLWKDMVCFIGMVIISSFMLAHVGLMNPLRQQISILFGGNVEDIA